MISKYFKDYSDAKTGIIKKIRSSQVVMKYKRNDKIISNKNKNKTKNNSKL
ncbi:uncharacterized protein ASCRUDRAFT_75688, partial [Ascoidea rubescens DSM 1968]